ncbi:conserved hypothetical protein [Ricinus communis]|uniref:Avr9/Cf-9 rapidly elicited protein 146 n=1 Tax=Ricinus communis TaxID=3988 RepID=B9RS04_RICCO|nr:conserved hypothetical protein [Ricinus communis]
MEPSPTPLLTKKLCNMIRIAFFTVQKGVSKSKFMVDLHLMMKRGKILKKAMNDLMLEHQASLSCRSDNMDMSFVSPMSCRSHDVHLSFVSPHEYEFSCSSSCSSYRPYNPRLHSNRRRSTRHYLRKHQVSYQRTTPYIWADDDMASEGSGGESQGFGWSPLVRQVRITDSPFTVRDGGDNEDSMKVDMEAEKFIDRPKFFGSPKKSQRFDLDFSE